MTKLSVNINKIALLRNSRGAGVPDLVTAARAVTKAGCHGITVHPRPDGRHIRRQDVLDLAQMLTVEFNIEGYPSSGFLELVCQVRPTQCTLVPDPPDALTSNAGWDLVSGGCDWLSDVVARLRDNGIRSSIFLEPEVSQVRKASILGADRIELFTGPYAQGFENGTAAAILDKHREAARVAGAEGLGVNAGHDLNLSNIPAYVASVQGVAEVSIGHALICDALYVGLANAVADYLKALGSKPRSEPQLR